MLPLYGEGGEEEERHPERDNGVTFTNPNLCSNNEIDFGSGFGGLKSSWNEKRLISRLIMLHAPQHVYKFSFNVIIISHNAITNNSFIFLAIRN